MIKGGSRSQCDEHGRGPNLEPRWQRLLRSQPANAGRQRHGSGSCQGVTLSCC
jgi:hypothetical protein